MTMSAQARQVKEAQRWIEEPEYWARKFLSGKDVPYIPTQQQHQAWEAYGRLIRAKYKRMRGAPMTDQEKQDARKFGVSIMSGHGTGKDAWIAGAGLHAEFCLPDAKVICTAPAGPQLHSVLWPEFAKWIQRSEVLPLIFEKQSDKIFLKERGGEQCFIKPRTIQPNSSPDEQAEVLAGIHSTAVIYLIDEASGVPPAVYKPFEGGMTDPIAIILEIFNPTQRVGPAIDHHTRDRENWICLQWDAEETRKEKLANPKAYFWFNEEAQEVLAKKYGRDSDFYRVRVKGLPPEGGDRVLVPYELAMAAVDRDIQVQDSDPVGVGVDVARGGEDKSIILTLKGTKVQGIKEYRELDGPQLANKVIGHAEEEFDEQDYVAFAVDVIGVGASCYDHLNKYGGLKNLEGVNVAEVPSDAEPGPDRPKFHRLRDEVLWNVREEFMSRANSIPNDDELIGELTSVRWDDDTGKIKVEGKKEMKKRGLASPNKLDAYALAIYARRLVARPAALASHNWRRRTRRHNAGAFVG